jgi:pimeloyl-ACP methyl ester carboxylesterase
MTSSTASRPVLLVHGAWHGAWSWAELQSRLEDLGVRSWAIDLPGHGISPLPLGDLSGDADAVVAALDRTGPDTLLVGHSYGGAVVSQAAARSGNVGHLLYIAAFALESGESVNGFLRTAPRHRVELAEVMQPTDDGATVLDVDRAGELLYASLPLARCSAMVARLSPQPNATMTQPLDGTGLGTVPSTYLLCARDRAVHPEHQRIMAARCDTTVELDHDHSPFLDDPELVAGIIADLARV